MVPGENVLGGQAWEIRPSGPDQEAVKAVIGDFRQLWTDHRPTSAMSVLKILRGSAKRRGSAAGAELVSQLEVFRRRLLERKSVDPGGKMLVEGEFGESREIAPEEIIDSWLNGEYLHDDLEKADQLGLGEGPGWRQ